jgi:hypothetical protein
MRSRLFELFPIMLHTDNMSANDIVWIHDCVNNFENACWLQHEEPNLLSDIGNKNRLDIQQQLGLIKSRLEEEGVLKECERIYVDNNTLQLEESISNDKQSIGNEDNSYCKEQRLLPTNGSK